MSSASVVSQLRGLLEKTDQLALKFDKIYPTEDQWNTLSDLSKSLVTAATTLSDKIRLLRESRAERAWKDSQKLRQHAMACKGDVLGNGRLKHSPVFRRNIITIFEGPKESVFDSEDIKIRKCTTRQRCAQIRRLSPDGLISWAIAFAPSVWAGGSMATDIFTCLLDDIEPQQQPSWPRVIDETLQMLLKDETALQNSQEYKDFMEAGKTPPKEGQARQKKRPRLDIQEQSSYIENEKRASFDSQHVKHKTSPDLPPQPGVVYPPVISQPPTKENREMKHMCTNAPLSVVSQLPEPFRAAVQNSRLFKWERSQGYATTNCLATLFPKDNAQDVSFTFWCGNFEGYDLTSLFGLQHAMSSQT